MIRYLIFLAFIVGLALSAEAQRMSEEEIGLEDLYIQANQKKLLGKYDEAIELYAKLLDKDQLNAPAHHDLARIHLELGDKDKAVDHAKKAVKFDPANKWFLLTLATIHEGNMQYREAAAAYEKIVMQNNDQDLYDRWANALVEAGDEEQAIIVYDQADTKWGPNVGRSDTKVDLYLALGKKKEAIKEVEQWVDDYPYEDEYKIKLSQFYLYIGEEKKATKLLNDLIKVSPDNEDALAMLQAMRSSSGDVVASDLASLINNESVSVDAKIKTLLPIVTNGKKAEVVEILPLISAMSQDYPGEAKAQALYGDALYLNEDITGAIEAYKKTLALNKSVYEVWEQLMRCLQMSGDRQELSKVSAAALDYYPNQAGPYYYQAIVALADGDPAEAEELIDEALLVSGGHGVAAEEALVLKSSLRQEAGDTKMAISLLQDKTGLSLPSSYEFLGDLMVADGNKPGAEKAYKKALELGGAPTRIKQKLEAI